VLLIDDQLERELTDANAWDGLSDHLLRRLIKCERPAIRLRIAERVLGRALVPGNKKAVAQEALKYADALIEAANDG